LKQRFLLQIIKSTISLILDLESDINIPYASQAVKNNLQREQIKANFEKEAEMKDNISLDMNSISSVNP
jgi:hypothetical protein